jgi:predicted DNA-binding antitoxin AbrB/MazE fold protein
MTLAVEAVFENGVLKPVNPLKLAEHQKVHLIVRTHTQPQNPVTNRWHWQESQAIEDGFSGAVGDEVARQRREG